MASEDRYILATKVLITDSEYMRGQRPGATATSGVYERLSSAVSSISSNIFANRLSHPAVVTPAAVTPGAITPAPIVTNSRTLPDISFLPPSYPIAILICFLLILALSFFGFSIAKGRAANNEKKWNFGDYHKYNAADTETPLTEAHFRGREQSPMLSNWVPGELLDFQRPENPIIVCLADVVDDPGSADEPSCHASVSSSSAATLIKSEFSSSPIREGTRGRPIAISDSDPSETTSQFIHGNVYPPLNRTSPNSILANASGSTDFSPETPSGSPLDYPTSPNYGLPSSLGGLTTTAAYQTAQRVPFLSRCRRQSTHRVPPPWALAVVPVREHAQTKKT